MVFGYDLLCDLLEMLNLINNGSAVATRRNLVDPIQRTNMRGLMAKRLRAFDLRLEGYRFESRWILPNTIWSYHEDSISSTFASKSTTFQITSLS
jgi:hypothetical protein